MSADPAWARARAEDASKVKARASKAQPLPIRRAAPPLVEDVLHPADQSAAARDRGQGRRSPALRDELQKRRRVVRPLRSAGQDPVVAGELGELAQPRPGPPGQRVPGKDAYEQADRPATRRGRAAASAPARGRRPRPSRWPVSLSGNSGLAQARSVCRPQHQTEGQRNSGEVRRSGAAARPSRERARDAARRSPALSTRKEPWIILYPRMKDETSRMIARPLRSTQKTSTVCRQDSVNQRGRGRTLLPGARWADRGWSGAAGSSGRPVAASTVLAGSRASRCDTADELGSGGFSVREHRRSPSAQPSALGPSISPSRSCGSTARGAV